MLKISPRPAVVVERSEAGFIIIAVLWVLALLATLVTTYAIFVSNTAAALAATTDRVQTEAAFRAAIEATSHRLLSGRGRNGSDTSAMRIGNIDVEVAAVSEAARIDINFASRDLLAGLITGFGEDAARAMACATRIVAWRTKIGPDEIDAEANLYRTAGLNYLPRRAPFAHVDELWLVFGLSPFVVARMMPHVTIYHGRAGVDLASASPQVIAGLPGMSPEKLQNVLALRASGTASQAELLRAAALSADSVTSEPARTFRITVAMRFDTGHQVRSEAVILLRDGEAEPYRVLSVRHDLDDDAGNLLGGRRG